MISHILILVIASAFADAAEVFTLHSGSCEGGSNRLASRVLVFSRGDATYALASDQGAYNDSAGEKGICAEVLDGERRASAKLVVHDARAGFALYRLDQNLRAGDLPELGFAANRDELKIAAEEEFSTRVLQVKSRRHHFPSLDFALELKGGTRGPSFSQLGSPAFNASGQLVGLLSRYYLMYRPGRTTLVRRWSPQAFYQNFGYVLVPAAHAFGWVEKVLAEASPPLWQLDLSRQLKGEYLLRGPGLSILESGSPDEGDLDEDGPIGGNDGFGIGGIDTAFSLYRISFFPNAGNKTLLPHSLKNFAGRIIEEENLTIAYRGERNPFAYQPVAAIDLDSFLYQADQGIRFFTEKNVAESVPGKSGKLARWVEALEKRQMGDWEWQWRHIKASPRLLSSFHRCLFYLAWLKSDEWESFPAKEWRREFDPDWGNEGQVLSIRSHLGQEPEQVLPSWEEIWKN